MTTEELIQMVRDLLVADLDNYRGENARDADIVDQLNWAQRAIAKTCYLIDPTVTMTPSAGSWGPYRLDDLSVFSKRLISVHSVHVSGVPLAGPNGNPGCWPFSQFEETYPSWRAAPSSVPSVAAMLGDQLVVWPAPSSLPAGITVCGQVLPPDLSASQLSASPQLPIDAHEPLALMAAAIAARPVATEAEGWRRLSEYRADAMQTVRSIGMRNFNQIHNRGINGYRAAVRLIRS